MPNLMNDNGSTIPRVNYIAFLFLIIITTASFLCFQGVVTLDFQKHWDDHWVVFNWYTEEGFASSNIKSIVSEYYHGQYSPINQFYYTTLYSINGYNAKIFHSAGLVIHLFNVVLVYVFIRRIERLIFEESLQAASCIGLLCTLIFALHPLFIEPVAWISASKVLLYALFFFIGLLSYLQYLSTKNRLWYPFAFACFVLSFLAKEQAVTFPLVLLTLEYLKAKRITQKSVVAVLPFFVTSLIFAIITINSQSANEQGIMSKNAMNPFIDRVCYGAYSVLFYVKQTIFPSDLARVYNFPNKANQNMPVELLIYPIALLTAIAFFVRKALKPRYLFGGLFFFTSILPAIHIIPISRVAIVADRYSYVASVGIIYIACHFVYTLFSKADQYVRYAITLVCCLYVFYLGFYTYSRIPLWKNSDSITNDIRHFKLYFK
ncbi:hypothetical protein [Pedobacter sp. SYP-B3415]|uniref:hypothetical protein n=1 Tax=Pedobacter sp. SYP-B3415 TaxID=2496641 RepID=UPI00101D734B|nr:hypothetical protein [Pedobacter sp. SYP-B3415]